MTELDARTLPRLIQGGMGMGISNWHLARAVGKAGQMGVISGTAIDTILIRRLQQGDPGGFMRQALDAFPVQDIANDIRNAYYIENGKAADAAFKSAPLTQLHMGSKRMKLIIVANFCEVWLAKQEHEQPIGINLLDKIAIPNLASLFGAMLGGVDVICMGAGIPHWVPEVIDHLSRWESAEINIPVVKDGQKVNRIQCIKPDEFGIPKQVLKRPLFLAIISSEIIGKSLLRRSNDSIDGFVVENFSAGGHNAPPRQKDASSIDDYGEKDLPNLQRIAALGLPFWLAGSFSSPEQYQVALDSGARGVQIGTPFAFCQDSGMDDVIRQDAIQHILEDSTSLETDFKASPTGYPFKILDIYKTVKRNSPCNARTCDLGYLRTVSEDENGVLSYSCPAEPMDIFSKKGGQEEDAEGKVCLCNGLMATCGVPQVRDGIPEAPVITAGDSVGDVKVLAHHNKRYAAQDVIDHVLS